mgnify:CR=1 FL=1
MTSEASHEISEIAETEAQPVAKKMKLAVLMPKFRVRAIGACGNAIDWIGRAPISDNQMGVGVNIQVALEMVEKVMRELLSEEDISKARGALAKVQELEDVYLALLEGS